MEASRRPKPAARAQDEINAEERRARAKKEAEKYDVNVCNELSSRVQTLEALVNRIAMARENDQKTIQDLQKRVSSMRRSLVFHLQRGWQLRPALPWRFAAPAAGLDGLSELGAIICGRQDRGRENHARTCQETLEQVFDTFSQSASSMEGPHLSSHSWP